MTLSPLEEDIYTFIKQGPVYGVTHRQLHDHLKDKYRLELTGRGNPSLRVTDTVRQLVKAGIVVHKKSEFVRRTGSHRYTLPENVKRIKNPHLLFKPPTSIK